MRYVAIGDSFTEGVGDERPDGTPVGWADRVAEGLAAAGEPVEYANLAIRGRLLAPIVEEQLEAALALSPPPTLMTFNGGGNDMLRPRLDTARLMALTEQVVRRCAESGVRLVLLAGADPSGGLPFGSTVHARAEQLTELLRELAAAHEVTFVDAFHDTELRKPGHWSPDRLHLNGIGHQRVADRVLAALGYGAVPAETTLPARASRQWSAEARYYREHVLPWVGRRLRRRSSGDDLPAKYPDWVRVPVPHDGQGRVTTADWSAHN